MFAIDYRTGIQLRMAYHAARRALGLHTEPFGLTADRYLLLRLLAMEGGACSQARLVEVSRVADSSVSTMLRVLVRKGFLRRSPDPTDGRRLLVSLTERGWVAVRGVRLSLDLAKRGRAHFPAPIGVA